MKNLNRVFLFGLLFLSLPAWATCPQLTGSNFVLEKQPNPKVPIYYYKVAGHPDYKVTVVDYPKAFLRPDFSTKASKKAYLTQFTKDRTYFHAAVEIRSWIIQQAVFENEKLELMGTYFDRDGQLVYFREWLFTTGKNTCQFSIDSSEGDDQEIADKLKPFLKAKGGS